MAHILHISCDFPDILVSQKTEAIKRLIDGVPSFDHTVYSLNRVNGFSGEEILEFSQGRFAVAYRAPPKGIFLNTRLIGLAKKILSHFQSLSKSCDLVHAHKLTIDGVVGHYIARKLGVPIVFSIQGDTDLKVIAARPDMSRVFAAHIENAAMLFPFAPWTAKTINARFPLASTKSKLLPVISAKNEFTGSAITGDARLVSVFHLDSWRRKNLHGLSQAIRLLSEVLPNIRLDIIGAGSPKSFLEAQHAVQNSGAAEFVRFRGPIPNLQIAAAMKDFTAFVLPTLRETYGLVHAEALFAGLPVVISRDMGIDGILPTSNYIKSCDPASPNSIADAILSLINNESVAKNDLRAAQLSGGLNIMMRDDILSKYQAGLQSVLRQKKTGTTKFNLETVTT